MSKPSSRGRSLFVRLVGGVRYSVAVLPVVIQNIVWVRVLRLCLSGGRFCRIFWINAGAPGVFGLVEGLWMLCGVLVFSGGMYRSCSFGRLCRSIVSRWFLLHGFHLGGVRSGGCWFRVVGLRRCIGVLVCL